MNLATRLNIKSPDEPHPVYACGYDWRQSNFDSADTLIARIDQVLARHPAAKQVILVTHSMGGLVARAALTKNAKSKILGVIHTVQPADGAVVAYRRFFTGATTPFDNPIPLNLIMGRNRVQYCLMQTGLRGPTELLPMNSYPTTFMRFGAGITNKFVNVYDEYPKQTTPGFIPEVGDFDALGIGIQIILNGDLVRLRRRIEQAGDFAKLVANVFHNNTFVLFGDAFLTDVEFDFTRSNPKLNGSGKDPRVIRHNDGDGTVPAVSARCLTSSAISREGEAVQHAECFSLPRFRDLVLNRVRRLMALPATPAPSP